MKQANYLQQNVIQHDIGINQMHIGLIFWILQYGSNKLEPKNIKKEKSIYNILKIIKMLHKGEKHDNNDNKQEVVPAF